MGLDWVPWYRLLKWAHNKSPQEFTKNILFVRHIGFEVLRGVVMNSSIFWDITPCSPLKIDRSFGRTCRLLQSRRINKPRSQHESRWHPVLCDMFHRNVSSPSTDYTALYPTRYNSSRHVFLLFYVSTLKYCHVVCVTIDGVWIGE
jgi:hypothetical protein